MYLFIIWLKNQMFRFVLIWFYTHACRIYCIFRNKCRYQNYRIEWPTSIHKIVKHRLRLMDSDYGTFSGGPRSCTVTRLFTVIFKWWHNNLIAHSNIVCLHVNDATYVNRRNTRRGKETHCGTYVVIRIRERS